MSDKNWYLVFYFLVLAVASVLSILKVIQPDIVVALIGGVLGHGLGALNNSISTTPQDPPAAG